MGSWLSRKKKEEDTIVLLEELTKKINELEEQKKLNVESQKRTVGLFVFYSVMLYLTIALARYFYFVTNDWILKMAYSAPLLLFPLLMYFVKRILHWYFVSRICKNESQLEGLKEHKNKILDGVMEKETYKKAKEILERFATETNTGDKSDIEEETAQEKIAKGESSVRKRNVHDATLDRSLLASSFMDTTVNQGPRPPPQPPGSSRPMPVRPILKPNRTYADKFVDFLLGDGPQHRYALICCQCWSHNGMALPEEFEFISFRCVYCSAFNPSRKQKPSAPKLSSRPTLIITETNSESEVEGKEEEGCLLGSTTSTTSELFN